MSRRAKIVCTLGPAVRSAVGAKALLAAGMDVARLNFSHGARADHEAAYGRPRRLRRVPGAASGSSPTCRARRFGSAGSAPGR